MKNAKEKINILYIDIEGGWGGSSRSLYYLIRHLDRTKYEPVVLYGKEGPNRVRYKEMGVPAYLFSPIPRVRALKKNNHKSLAIFILKLIHLPRFLVFVKRIIRLHKIQVIHMNQSCLFFVALFLKRMADCKIVYHVRTMLPKNIFGKIQMCIVRKTADYIIFITENEQSLWHEVCPLTKNIPQSVIYNSAEPVYGDGGGRLLGEYPDRFRIAAMSTMTYTRGIDRLLDVAHFLREKNHNRSLFVICSQEGRRNAYAESIRRDVAKRGLGEFFLFLGYQSNPERLLSECSAFIHLTRDHNPWGRNIIEAIAQGKPVISIGAYQGFVQDAVNGYLLPEFDPEVISEKIIYLSDNPAVVKSMEEENIKKGKRLFDARANTEKVVSVYEGLMV
ncbi:MAG: glycosyltransferase family 4 protein [Candidatus Omnitrophica bacterium]|nr:glycosyltransferase family 4 protein [Candidatus Omnitrophota bacterium]